MLTKIKAYTYTGRHRLIAINNNKEINNADMARAFFERSLGLSRSADGSVCIARTR